MKVLFTENVKYAGMDSGKYKFEDKYGDTIMTKQAKLVNRDSNIVIMFLDANGNEDIQYSYATKKRLGSNSTSDVTAMLSMM